MRVLAALVLPAAVLLPVAYVGHRLSSEEPPPPLRPTAIVWADRVFTSKADLASWLRARGGSYRAWAQRHPALAQPRSAPTAAGAPDRVPAAASAGDDAGPSALLLIGGFLALCTGFVLAVQVRRQLSGRGPPRRRRVGRSVPGAPLAMVWRRLSERPPRPRRVGRSAPGTALAMVRRRLSAGPLRARRVGRSVAGALTILRAAPRQAVVAVDHMRRERDDVGWYLAAFLFAAAVGALLPYSLR